MGRNITMKHKKEQQNTEKTNEARRGALKHEEEQ
jgi:hypothetical protein